MNTTSHDSNTATTNKNDKMKMKMTTRKIKISFQGASRDVDLPSPFTLAGLQQAIASTFATEMPARSSADQEAKDKDKESDLSFTYKDPEGDDIVFDKDSELSLALRLCPSSLEITAALKETAAKKNPDPEVRLYATAARNLREYNGVPSMTPAKLIKTLAFLKLNPRRLVKQGLAPKALLVRMAVEAKKNKRLPQSQPQPLGGGGDKSGHEDLAESVADGVQVMSVEDDKKEWNDGFVSVESAPAPAPAAPVTAEDVAVSPSSGDAENVKDNAHVDKKNVLHEAFIAGGIQLRPREVRPLLLALDVRPCRLVKLGYVDGKHLRVMLQADKMATHKRSGNGSGNGNGNGSGNGDGPGPRQRVARGCGPRGGSAPGGKPCGRMMMMRRNLHAVPHPPPPPPAMVGEEERGMSFVPAKRGGGGGGHRGGRHALARGAPHGPPHGHPRHGRVEEGEEGARFHRGPAPVMMVRMRQARSGPSQQQQGYYYSG